MKNCMQTLEVCFFLVKTVAKLWNLQISKILNTNTNRFFPIPFTVMCILWDIPSLRNSSTVGRSGYFRLFGMNQKFSLKNAGFFFLNWNFSKIYIKRNNNQLLLKSMLKHLAFCHAFWVEGVCQTNPYLCECSCFITEFPITCHAKKLI